MQEWPEPVERVAAVLRARGIDARLEEFEDATPTAAAAATAVGCEAGEIVKSLVFICDGLPVLVLVPGVIGRVGTLFGDAGVNIANMTVSRTRRGGKALMVLTIDSMPPPELVERFRAEGFDDARVVELDHED